MFRIASFVLVVVGVGFLSSIAMSDEKAKATQGTAELAAGQEMPFHVVDFHVNHEHAGCPSVMIANTKSKGVIVWCRTPEDSVLELAQALDGEDKAKLRRFVVLFDVSSNALNDFKTKASVLKQVVVGKARSTAQKEFDGRGLKGNAQVVVFFLDRKTIKLVKSFAAIELTPDEIRNIGSEAAKFAAEVQP